MADSRKNDKLWREPVFVDLAGGKIEARINLKQNPSKDQKPHFHPHFELLYITRGTRNLELNGRQYSADAGDLMIFRPGDAHIEFAGTETVSYFVFRFKPGELAEAGIEFPRIDKVGPVISLPRKEMFYDIFNSMVEEFENPGEGSDLILGAYLVEFVIKLRRAINEILKNQISEGVDSVQLRVSRAMDLMEKNLTGSLDLEKIAGSAFMSVSHFSHTFKEKTGESPKRFLIRGRIEMAKRLLETTDKTAMRIAEELGYESPYFFYRQFRSKTGMTANRYRAKHRRKVHME
ncbi:MAG: hypothetical protein A2X48_01245 [Lentisphaerae bacterium GWF2_49_21]|nr:MAG: hypothetical protein A2X48_01245 [Lentisphaerae bacterium GWF2_49_21]